jgi:hypothetical protein
MKFTAIKAGWMRRLGLAAGLLTLALAGCGGGTEIEPFNPNRILSFGDEMSVINADGTINGTKYTVNYLAPADNTSTPNVPAHIDCTSNPLWIQMVASHYGMAYDKCPGASTMQAGHIYAAAGAKSTDLDAQIASVVGAFTDKDLVTVMVGMNDVLAAYDQYPGTSEADLVSALTDKGKQLAAKVNNVAMQGPAVIVATVPDLGLTPYALLQEKNVGTGRAALLTRLTDAFNKGLRTNLINDGHLVGLVSADLEVQRMVELPTYYGLLNVNQPVCLNAYNSPTGRDDLALLQTCTTDAAALVKDVDNNGARVVDNTGSSSAATATPSYYLWAGNLMLSAHGQAQLGSIAVSRADGNPF